MSIIKQKREQFVSALERARHSSGSSLDEFNTSLSCMSAVDSIDAFSDPFSSEVSECSSIFNESGLCDLFAPTEWSSHTSAPDSLPGSLELCEWNNIKHQGYWPQQTDPSLDLYCGEDDFLATAEDAADILSKLANGGETSKDDFIDIIDHRQFNYCEAVSDSINAIRNSPKYLDLLADTKDCSSLKTATPDNKCNPSNILKEDPWLFDGSTPKMPLPQLLTLSPDICFSTIHGTEVTQHNTSYVSTKSKRNISHKRVLGVKNKFESKHGSTPRKTKGQILTLEDILIRKEKNRLRSKAYRERRKSQFQSLQEQVILAKLEANIAKKQVKLSRRH